MIALVAASPQVRGADLRPSYFVKAPPSDPGRCSWWGEGGGIEGLGGNISFGNGFSSGKSSWGPEGALGFDCTFGPSPWHVSAQARYGAFSQSGTFNTRGTFLVPAGTAVPLPAPPSQLVPVGANGSGAFVRREDHGLADFAVGRDVGLGFGQSQIKFGLRIAEIESRISGNGSFNVPLFAVISPPALPAPFGFNQNSRFVGGGPRLGIDGSVPLGSGWAFEYLGGVAALYGSRSLDVSGTGAAAAAGFNNFGASDFTTVFNLDAQAGLSYQLTQNLKLTASYRFDGYWGALKTFNAGGGVVNEDRFFSGPMLRLTGATDGIFGYGVPAPFIGKARPSRGSEWTVWAEGGAFNTGGGTVHFGDPVDAGKPKLGGEGAAGFDFRVGTTPWHVSADVRYGTAKGSGTFSRNGTLQIPQYPTSAPGAFVATPHPTPAVANGSFTQREEHALADFAVGRDVGLGIGQTQVKAGLRIAEIDSRTTGSGNFVAPSAFAFGFTSGPVGARPGAFSFEQNSRFVGGGPRVGIEGAIPLGYGWALDYMGGMAGLYGVRSLNVSTSGTASAFGFNNMGVSDTALIFNVDAQAGLSYWITQDLKVTAGYRFDGYWGALKTFNAAGNVVNEDRTYVGPTLRLTAKF